MNVRVRSGRRSAVSLRSCRRVWCATAAVAVGLVPGAAWAATYTVTSTADDGSPGTLRYAINQANANPGSTINFAAHLPTIALTADLPPINADMTIVGGTGDGISGSGAHRIFFVNAGTVVINNLILQDGVAQGGTGGSGSGGGGGGLGAGGAIFIRGNDGGRTAPNVTLSNLTLTDNKAVGGTGGAGVSGDKAGGGGAGWAGPAARAGTTPAAAAGRSPARPATAASGRPATGAGPAGPRSGRARTAANFRAVGPGRTRSPASAGPAGTGAGPAGAG